MLQAPFFYPNGSKMNYPSSDYSRRDHLARLTTIVVAVLMLVLAGCAPLPARDAPPTLAAARVGDIVPDAAPAAASAASSAPVPGDYGDAQLSRLVALAL